LNEKQQQTTKKAQNRSPKVKKLNTVGEIILTIMKTMKLNALENQSLSNREMKAVRGGENCGCGCKYENNNGSSTSANNSANSAGGLHSPGTGGNYEWTGNSGGSGRWNNVPAQSAGAYTVSQ
jgi:natural product precursor